MGKTASLANIGSIADSSLGFRNRIINGAMVIDQRNAGAPITTSGGFPVDRFKFFKDTSAAVLTYQQSSTAPAGFTNSVSMTVSTIGTVAAGEGNTFLQNIEGFNVADLGWGAAGAATVTLSFWVRSSVTGTFGGSLTNSGNSRAYPFTYTISSANTFEQKSITIAGDTTGTWNKTTGSGIIVWFSVGTGSTLSAAAGAWAAGNYISATGATNLVGTSGATWFITGVQLEKGSTATSFDYRPYGTELQLCKRYYDKTFAINTAPAQNAGRDGALETLAVRAAGAAGISNNFRFSVPMRTTPATVTFYNPSAANGQARNLDTSSDCTSTAVNFINEVGAKISYTLPASTVSTNLISVHWSADAEL